MKLPKELALAYRRFRTQIDQRLAEFSAPHSFLEYFYEFCYCLCTPQSKATHALRVVEILRTEMFYERGFDPAPILGHPSWYIRFHNVKARRLLMLRSNFPNVYEHILNSTDGKTLRQWIVAHVDGLGMKEASHVLRNCGWFDVAILDRHIITNLARYGVITEAKAPRSIRQYLDMESAFENFAASCGIKPERLDLLLWAVETGEVLK